jgi:hypothetical protein
LVVMVRLVVVVKVVVGRRWTEVQKVGSECVEVLVAAAAVAPAPALAPAAAPAPAQVLVLPCHTLQRTSQRTAHMHRHYMYTSPNISNRARAVGAARAEMASPARVVTKCGVTLRLRLRLRLQNAGAVQPAEGSTYAEVVNQQSHHSSHRGRPHPLNEHRLVRLRIRQWPATSPFSPTMGPEIETIWLAVSSRPAAREPLRISGINDAARRRDLPVPQPTWRTTALHVRALICRRRPTQRT